MVSLSCLLTDYYVICSWRWGRTCNYPYLFISASLTDAKEQGHLATQIGSRGMAYRIIGIDHGSKEDLVRECGAEVFFDITKFDNTTLPEAVKKATGGLGASAVIVCTAANGAYAQALGFLRFGGTLVCVGIPEGDQKEIANAFPGHIVSLISSYTCSNDPTVPGTYSARYLKLTPIRLPKNGQYAAQQLEIGERLWRFSTWLLGVL